MFNTYADIFNKRGAAYHRAMQTYPAARDEEFRTMLGLLQPASGQIIVDMPSGGGYMRRYLGANTVQLIAVETTEAFHSQCPEDEHTKSVLSDLNNLPMRTESADSIVSMAGLHHVEDRLAVFDEMHRVLKTGGSLCIADVEQGSMVDGFLNTFVNDYNSMGHAGRFVDTDFRMKLRQANFKIEFDELLQYHWHFKTVGEMVHYCTLMFGLDKADPEQVLEGITLYQGYEEGKDSCDMNWELRFIRCTKG